jgi:hypothetical protein
MSLCVCVRMRMHLRMCACAHAYLCSLGITVFLCFCAYKDASSRRLQ